MAELNIARRRTGEGFSSITRLEKYVLDLEGKEKVFHMDELAIKGYQKTREPRRRLQGFRCSVINLVELDEEVLLDEQDKYIVYRGYSATSGNYPYDFRFTI